MRNPVTIGVAGAGSIGAYLGGRLAAAGHRVVLLGRQRLADAVADQGLRLTALDGFDQADILNLQNLIKIADRLNLPLIRLRGL